MTEEDVTAGGTGDGSLADSVSHENRPFGCAANQI